MEQCIFSLECAKNTSCLWIQRFWIEWYSKLKIQWKIVRTIWIHTIGLHEIGNCSYLDLQKQWAWNQINQQQEGVSILMSFNVLIYFWVTLIYRISSLVNKYHVQEYMKERVSKLTYPPRQHRLRMLYTMNGHSKH